MDVKDSPFSARWQRPDRRRTLLAIFAVAVLIAGAFGLTNTLNSSTPAWAAGSLPCDFYAAGNTPCITAHSTIRALFSSYSGPLYQIQRASDKQYLDISVQAAGGYANAAPQATFCSGTSCTITKIYDQTSEHNDLPISSGGLWHGPGPNGSDIGANAMALPVTVAGHLVYGVKFTPGTGYRVDNAKGAPTGSQPEGIYMVTSSNDVNGQCCFDYGSGETSHTDTGNSTMNAIYWGTACWFGTWANNPCVGTGPWVEADLENGMYHTNTGSNKDSNNTGVHFPFVSAWEKNNGTSNFTLKYGNAQSGSLTRPYSGPLPNGYSPMKLEPSILLGTGGDNSNADVGEFFEGAVTAGYPSDATENLVQSSIVAAGYGSNVGPTPTPTTGTTPTPTAGTTPTPTAGTTPTPTTGVTPTPTTGTTPTPSPTTGTTPTPTPSPTPTQGGGTCKVSYVANQWPGGFTANLTVTNTGSSPINGWTLTFSFPGSQQVTQGWNGVYSQSGSNVTVTNASYNGSIPVGASVNPGFNGSWSGSNPSPTAFTLNGAACS